MKRAVTALVALLLLVAGCSSSTSGGSSDTPTAGGTGTGTGTASGAVKGKITVYAAASLTEAFGTIKTQFEQKYPGTSITFNFGASSDLATQITQGAPVDVFASASTKNMQQIGGAAVSPTNFVTNTLEIAVPPSNPGKITSVQDLTKSGVKVATCAPAVPCGVVATQVFKNAKIDVKPAAQEADVKSTLAAVTSGEVDAGLVYVTDVRSAGSKVKGVTIPANVNASTEYPIASLKNAGNAPAAKAFVEYVLSAAGTKVLTADGFSHA